MSSQKLTAVKQVAQEGFVVKDCKNPDCKKKEAVRMRENAEYCSTRCKRKHNKAMAREHQTSAPELELAIEIKPRKQLTLFGDDD